MICAGCSAVASAELVISVDEANLRGVGVSIGEKFQTLLPVTPSVRAKQTVEADTGWPRRVNLHDGLERPDGGCRSGSALERGVRPQLSAGGYRRDWLLPHPCALGSTPSSSRVRRTAGRGLHGLVP